MNSNVPYYHRCKKERKQKITVNKKGNNARPDDTVGAKIDNTHGFCFSGFLDIPIYEFILNYAS
jgi:hypothetical protein